MPHNFDLPLSLFIIFPHRRTRYFFFQREKKRKQERVHLNSCPVKRESERGREREKNPLLPGHSHGCTEAFRFLRSTTTGRTWSLGWGERERRRVTSISFINHSLNLCFSSLDEARSPTSSSSTTTMCMYVKKKN